MRPNPVLAPKRSQSLKMALATITRIALTELKRPTTSLGAGMLPGLWSPALGMEAARDGCDDHESVSGGGDDGDEVGDHSECRQEKGYQRSRSATELVALSISNGAIRFTTVIWPIYRDFSPALGGAGSVICGWRRTSLRSACRRHFRAGLSI